MNVAIVSLFNRFGDKTGDMVQAEKTACALKDLGLNVLRGFLKPETGEIFGVDGVPIGKWGNVLAEMDIVHAMPPIPWVYIKRQVRIKAKLVCSTVFWRSYTYTRVLHRSQGRLTPQLIKDYLRIFLAWIGVPTYFSYRGYDLLLPNSEDEMTIFKRYCRIKKEAIVCAIPNAIDSLPNHVAALPRSEKVPKDDYILVPGVFAARKNQGLFIDAMKNSPCPVVFIGGGPLLQSCKNMSNERMIFLGHIPHGSQEFYAIMKYARVVCLPSNCETPGIAALEAASLGARPVVPYEGGTCQYYGWDAEYLNPLSKESIRRACDNAWCRGRLRNNESNRYREITWEICGRATIKSYEQVLSLKNEYETMS